MRGKSVTWYTGALALAVMLTALQTFASSSAKKQEAEALFARAYKLTNIEAKGSPAFAMDASVTLYGSDGSHEEGDYHLVWKSDGDSRAVYSFPDYHEVAVRQGPEVWISSTYGYVPYLVDAAVRNLCASGCPTLPHGDKVHKIRSERINGVSARCVTTKEKGEYCFDTAAGRLISTGWGKGSKLKTGSVYSDYAAVDGKQCARVVRVTRDGQLIIQIKITKITLSPHLMTSTFKLPIGPNLRHWPFCTTGSKDLVQAKPKYTPDPPFPDVARQQRRAGDVIISANVGVDGHLGDLCVLESAGPNFARSAIETISQWRMTPWECKGAPVERRELIDVTFRLAP